MNNFPEWLYHFKLPPETYEKYSFFASLQAFSISLFFLNFCSSNRCVVTNRVFNFSDDDFQEFYLNLFLICSIIYSNFSFHAYFCVSAVISLTISYVLFYILYLIILGYILGNLHLFIISADAQLWWFISCMFITLIFVIGSHLVGFNVYDSWKPKNEDFL